MKKLIVLLVVLLVGCHQYGVLLKSPHKYIGDMTEPTLLLSPDRQGTFDCDKLGALAGVSVWLKVINPTDKPIFPNITCRYYLDGVHLGSNDRNIKSFEVPAGNYRRLMVDNSVMVNNCKMYDVKVYCDMNLYTVKRYRSRTITPITITLIPKLKEVKDAANYTNPNTGFSIR